MTDTSLPKLSASLTVNPDKVSVASSLTVKGAGPVTTGASLKFEARNWISLATRLLLALIAVPSALSDAGPPLAPLVKTPALS